MPLAHRIDTHHHSVPRFYAQWLQDQGQAAGGLPIPDWSEDDALGLMDACGIEQAVLSISTPGVHLGDDHQARAMAQRVNDAASELCARRPERFRFFATLTLPDVEGAIAEHERVRTAPGASGVVLLANVNGQYLGDVGWDPLMSALNANRSVVFVHPSTLPGPAVEGIPAFAADFLLDTTRAAIQYSKNGCHERSPQVQVILSHAGGFIPYARRAQSLHFAELLDRFPMTPEQRQAIERGNAMQLLGSSGHASAGSGL